MAELTLAQDEHVQYLITQFMDENGVDRSMAIKQLHLFVCKGACSWYRNSGGTGTGFDYKSLTPDQRKRMKNLLDKVAAERNVTSEDLMKWFHVFKCHS
jgi:hypothetical protein